MKYVKLCIRNEMEIAIFMREKLLESLKQW